MTNVTSAGSLRAPASFAPTPAPTVVNPYDPEKALEDLPAIKHAEALFLNSAMNESEQYCMQLDPRRERLYITSGYSLIQCLKALMSFEDDDLKEANEIIRYGNALANRHRAASASIVSRLAGLFWDSFSVAHYMSISSVQRHAELLYAETLFVKALLGVVCSGSWLSFIAEALSFRTMINTYLSLGRALSAADYAARSAGQPFDASLDNDFRSGVELGVGASNLILSFLPDRLIAVAEVFGYQGDREEGLRLLMKAGGWVKGEPEPRVGIEQEGLRRSLADICLLCFHLVISTATYKGVDITMAQTILDWNLRRYPNGVFFHMIHGRLLLIRTNPLEAVQSYERALNVLAVPSAHPIMTSSPTTDGPPVVPTTTYRSLTLVTHWEIALAHLTAGDIRASLSCWLILLGRRIAREVGLGLDLNLGVASAVLANDEEGASWSRTCYAYGVAMCLLELEETEGTADKKVVRELMRRVPDFVNRIAGKSIPIEKFISRKARRYLAHGHLTLPSLELAYIFQCIAHAPRRVLVREMLPRVEAELKRLGTAEVDSSGTSDSSSTGSVTGLRERSRDRTSVSSRDTRWDDLCLAWFLHGVCLRYIAFPERDAHPEPGELNELPYTTDEAARRSLAVLELVLEHGQKIALEHYVVYHAHFEVGRLRMCMGNYDKARGHFDIVLSGKALEKDLSARKGKYSMQSALMMRTSAAVEELDQTLTSAAQASSQATGTGRE